MNAPTLRPMTADDYADVMALLARTAGVSIREADSFEATLYYLERNPGLSFVAHDGGRLLGCLMAGHDGRRGYLQHLAVTPDARQRGLAAALIERCLAALEGVGIRKAHVDVFCSNADARTYWERRGWRQRDEIVRYSRVFGDGGDNA